MFIHTQAINDICNPLLSLNISTFSHVRMMNDSSFSCIVTNPAFAKNYVEKKHYHADVHADKNHCHLLNCLMWDNIEAKGATANMLQIFSSTLFLPSSKNKSIRLIIIILVRI